MTPLRLVLVTRRFWPLVGGAEMVMANLASEFRQRGAQPILLTAQWEVGWPKEVVHREVPVVRLPNPPQRGWGTIRYVRSLSRWLRRRRGEIDLVCVSMLKHDAYAVIGAMQGAGVPVVLRAEGGGATGDCQWQQTARFGKRIHRRCLLADAIVAPSEAIAAELVETGYDPGRVHFIPNGVAVGRPSGPEARAAARAALAEANPDLAVGEGAPVVVFTGRLDRAKGLFELVEAWTAVGTRWPNARLWLVGEGPHREPLQERIVQFGLHHQVVLTGAFDEIDEVLLAADLFVLPSHQEGMSLSLLEAMAAGLPVVATDIPGNRRLLVDGEQGVLAPPRNAAVLGQRMMQLLAEPNRATALGLAARNRVRDEFSLQRTADGHWDLFTRLMTKTNGTPLIKG